MHISPESELMPGLSNSLSAQRYSIIYVSSCFADFHINTRIELAPETYTQPKLALQHRQRLVFLCRLMHISPESELMPGLSNSLSAQRYSIIYVSSCFADFHINTRIELAPEDTSRDFINVSNYSTQVEASQRVY